MMRSARRWTSVSVGGGMANLAASLDSSPLSSTRTPRCARMNSRFFASRKAAMASGRRSSLRKAMAAARQSRMAVSARARYLPSATWRSASSLVRRRASSSASDSLSSRRLAAAFSSSASTELASISSAWSTTLVIVLRCFSESDQKGPSLRGVQTVRGVMTLMPRSETPSLVSFSRKPEERRGSTSSWSSLTSSSSSSMASEARLVPGWSGASAAISAATARAPSTPP
mmetsp:Transcript_19088/g.59997  ORF Transcript_19088/g.59997 Transcript_19088/m.59997 type:complete len:229 (+) Transcript_19088:550-1236(+)